jgi:carbonic anhydrase
MFDLVYRFDPCSTSSIALPQTSEEACDVLVKGNRKFAELTDTSRKGKESHIIKIDPRSFGWGATNGDAPAQAPFAAILGCSDARVPTEMVFSKACNEIFVVRVAGNVLGNECLGSLHYVVKQFPSTLKIVVVLAHGGCGAVTQAVEVFLKPRRYIEIASDHPLRSIHDQILVAVRVASMAIEELYGASAVKRERYRDALIEAAVVINAAWTAYCLRQEFRTRRQSNLGIYFGIYDLKSRFVRLPLSLPDGVTAQEKGLFKPPEDVGGFRRLALKICEAPLIQALLR